MYWDEKRNQELHEQQMAARERAMASHADFVRRNPGAVSPQERAAAEKWRFDNGLTGRERELQDFERGMAQDRIRGEVRVAHEKRLGMENQGVGAAKVNAGTSITNTEREWAGRESIAGKQAENALELEQERQRGALQQHEREWGGVGADGTRSPGARERIAEIEGKSRVEAAKQQAEAQARIEAQRNVLAAQKERARLEARYKGLDIKEQQGIDALAQKIVKEKRVSLADARAEVMAAREQAQQQGGEAWPGYSAERTAELKKRGYTLVNGKPVKAQ